MIAVVDPMMEVSGILSSWLTIARNSARIRSSSSTSAMSWRVTTIDSTPPSSERIRGYSGPIIPHLADGNNKLPKYSQ